MELVNPGIGLVFWMLLAFGVVLFVLRKFAWPAIMQALKEREQHIEEALHAADIAREEMKKLKLDNEELLRQAKEERDQMMADAKKCATNCSMKPARGAPKRPTALWPRHANAWKTNAWRPSPR